MTFESKEEFFGLFQKIFMLECGLPGRKTHDSALRITLECSRKGRRRFSSHVCSPLPRPFVWDHL
jgi:hypothetical protein